jgi:hypothetical protein
MTASAGTLYADVVPRFGQRFGSQLARQISTPATRASGRAGTDAGARFGQRFAGAFKGAGIAKAISGPLLAAVGGAALLSGLKATTQAASDRAEALNKSNVIFGANARAIAAWSKGSARAFGVSRTEALSAASSFGDMFGQLGLGAAPATSMSKRMVALAADLGSFHNADITQVLEAQQGAFRGEYDALQRFVPGINAARVEQEALRQTHKGSAKDLTAAEKAQAAYAIMLRDTSRAQGDFARTSGDAANRQRIARAQFEDMKATLGRGLLPVYNAVLGFVINKLGPGLAKLWGWVATGVKAFRGFWETGKAGGELLDGVLRPAFDSIVEALRPAIAAFVDGLLPGLKTLWHVIATTLWPALKVLAAVIGVALYAALRYVIPFVLRLAGPVLGALIGVVAKAIGWIGNIIKWLVRTGVAAFNLGRTIVRFVGTATTTIGSLPGKAWSALSTFAAKLRDRAREALEALIGKVKALIGSTKDKTGLLGWFAKLPGSIANALSGLGRALVDKFSGAIKAVLEFLGIHSPSEVFARIGRQMVAGLAKGIADRMKTIPDLLGKLRTMAGDVLFGGPAIARGSYGSNRAILRAAARSYGWAEGAQWIALANLISGESGFNNLAQNPNSTAFGMGQFLDSTWATVGARKTGDPRAQSDALLRYIAKNYGTPGAAYGAWLSRQPHWYGSGGVFTRPTVIGVGERGPEAVVPLARFGGGGIDYDRLAAANAASFAQALHGSRVELDGERVGALVVEPQFQELLRMLRGGRSR